jgi:hypothetical protein
MILLVSVIFMLFAKNVKILPNTTTTAIAA